MALDDSSAEAHTSPGIVELDYEGDIEGGRREFLRAMQLKPGFSWARHWHAHSLEADNRMEDALREMKAALDLDPLSIPIHWDIAAELIILRRFDEALRLLSKAGDLFPGVDVFDYVRTIANWRMGNDEAARRAIESLEKQPGTPGEIPYLTLLAADEAREGKVAEARGLLARIDGMRKTQYVEPFMVIGVCKALNDRAQLFVWLRWAEEQHSTMYVYRKAYASMWGLDAADLAGFEKGGAGR